MQKRENLRNVAIIAHVDHGKTTLVDSLLRQSGVFRDNEEVATRVMDSNDLERERGITILAKNTAVRYGDTTINIIDTPGHADFGGEVERVLTMVEGVLLLVDSFEGAMPQTRYVLKKAIEMGKKPIVCVNKIDKDNARPEEVLDQVLDLFIDLGADESQLDYPVVYTSGRAGFATLDYNNHTDNMEALFKTIIEQIPAPEGYFDEPLQLIISNIDSDQFLGKIGVGRVIRGSIHANEIVSIANHENDTTLEEKIKTARIQKLMLFEGLKRVEVTEASVGDIVLISGIPDVSIGDTICEASHPDPLPFVKIDEPVLTMLFSVNSSPFAGREGKYVTSRNIRERLEKELITNVALRVEDTASADIFKVSGRGELHLSILIENMRREGFEFEVTSPEVILKDVDGVICEPIEHLYVQVPEQYVGTIIEKISSRKGELLSLEQDGSMSNLEFLVPARGLIGYRQEFIRDTNGNGQSSHQFESYEPYKGEIVRRVQGSIVCHETGDATAYGLFNAEDRGELFIGPGEKVYEGEIVGLCNKSQDLTINVCKKKQLTNMRASGSDDALKLSPPTKMTLEKCLEFIKDDELVEVTPVSIRMRKSQLSQADRMKSLKN